MNVLKYVQGLLPMFRRDRLEEDARITRTALETQAITAYKRAEEVFSTKPRSKVIQKLQDQWLVNVKTSREKDLVPAIRRKLEECLPAMDLIDQVIASDFEADVVVAGITIKKATVVRLLELEAFIATYALRLLNYIYVAETAEQGSKNHIQDQLSPGEIRLLENHFFEFCTAINAVARSERELVKTFDSLPEVLVNSRGEAALSALSSMKIDPLNVFAIRGFTYNPIYHIGQIVAEMQAASYKRNVELLSVLELRALKLEQERAGNPDANVDRELGVVQGRIDSLSEKIRKAEESIK